VSLFADSVFSPHFAEALLLVAAIAIWVWYLYVRNVQGEGHDPLGGRPAPAGPWNEVDLWVVVGVFLGLQFVVSMLLSRLPAGADGATPLAGPLSTPESGRLFWQLAASCISNAVIVAVVLLVTLWHREGRLDHLGLATDRPARHVAFGVAGVLAILPVVYGLFWVSTQLIRVSNPPHPIEETLGGGAPPEVAAVALLAGLLAAPVGEELFFRGFLQSWLRPRFGPKLAIVITAVLFGLMHVGLPHNVLPLTVLGLMLGYLYERSGSLLVPVTLHFAFNAIPTVALLLKSASGP